MFKMKKILLALLIIVSISTAQAQNEVNVDLTADFVSSTIWRGSYLGGASVQPEVSVGWRGLELSAWGSAGVADGRYEIDLTLSYTIGGLTLSVVDYWDYTGETSFFTSSQKAQGIASKELLSTTSGLSLHHGRPSLPAATIRKQTTSVPSALILKSRHLSTLAV